MATQKNSQSSNGGGPAAKDIFRGVAGVAALGFAGRALYKETRRPRVMGVRVPRDVANVDLKKLAKQVSKVAEDWPERSVRQRRWVSVAEALGLLEDPGLREVVRAAFAQGGGE